MSAETSCPSSAARISSAVYSGSNIGGDGNRGGELLRVRHRQLDLPHAEPLGARRQPSGQPYGRLRPARDLDLAPGEVHGDAEAERLADGLLAGKPRRVVLRRVRTRVAVGPLGLREAAGSEARVALESPPDTADLDQIHPYRQ